MCRFFLGMLVLLSVRAYGQFPNKETYDIVKAKSAKDCAKFVQTVRSQPRDIRFQALVKHDSAFFIHNDIEWLQKMISSKRDGIAIDLVAEDQFKCTDPTASATDGLHRGYLLPPIYRDELIKNSRLVGGGMVIAFAGKIPAQLSQKNLEANLLILEDRNRCYYNNVVNIDYHAWQLLQTGLYYDTLTQEKIESKYKQLSKTLRFVIPFDKDKVEYKAEDIKPLYDSLQITDYAIQSINISAYTSVEGSFDRNIKLQNDRAESIVKALQTYQSEKITSTVSASEDWVEFLEDVSSSIYSSFLTMSKSEVKERLRSEDLLRKLEPILRKERKAIVELKLEKRLSYKETNKDQLKSYFHQSLAQRNIDEALYLQQIIFLKIRKEELPDQFLSELEVPEIAQFGSLLINHRAFLADNEYDNVFEAIKAFEKLDVLLPNNSKIKYNLCVLRMRAWLQTDLLVEKEGMAKEINALRAFKIPEMLVKRLMINYHIVLSEIAIRKRDYAVKDKSVQFIYNTYRSLKMNDDDLVNMSRYFCYYNKFDWGEQILLPRSKAIDVSEELLFYYINLTIFSDKNTANKFYRIILLNAVNRNKTRFCAMFNSISKGGITFQLLDNAFLKRIYCENCNN